LPKKTFEVAAAANIELIVQIKDNQPTLLHRAHEIAAATVPLNAVASRTRGRNRDERRTVSVFDIGDKLASTDWQPYVKSIIRVDRDCYTRNSKTGLLKQTTETAFYAGNATFTAIRAAEAVRGHWKIETTSHYSRDVTFAEDRSRIRTKPGVFARVRSFAFNILKANRRDTLPQDRYRAALSGIDQILKLLDTT
jgi:predicted transposase YbfD/YdcC